MGNKKENKEIDSKEKALDYAILDYLRDTTNPNLEGGYEIGGRHYDNYMSNDEWKKFLREMSPLHIDMYNKGRGEELKEGRFPPHMASFGSSSRFIYKLSKDIPGFVFEKQLPTRVGGTANLDGFLQKEDKNIYIEAKCREIYGNHNEIKKAYEKVYEKIDVYTNKEKRTFFYNGEVIEHFDIKQLICHFLGIAADFLENKHTKKIKFIYLIFDPREVEDKIVEDKEEILEIYKETTKQIKRFGKNLFKKVWDYQKESLKYNDVEMPEFEFKVCSQFDYKENIKK